jgi:hypothetical protein
MEPDETFGTQLTEFFIVAVVPESCSGSHTYVDLIRLLLTHRSPMYIAPSPKGRMKLVWLVYVFDPESAKVFHEDQGPEIFVAVE